MLRIIESTSSGQARSYYTTADYYTEGQELVGQWQGRGARRLGLFGEIQQDDWQALCDNQHPQSGEQLTLRQAVLALSESRTLDGFRQLDDLGWVREVPDEQRYQALANDYLDTVRHGETALIVCPTHREADSITSQLRGRLQESGNLGTDSRTLTTLRNANLTQGERADAVNYQPGDVLVFHQNAKGFTKGQRVTVTDDPPPVDQAGRFQVFHAAELQVAVGDILRITQNGKTLEGQQRLHNGDLVRVTGFDDSGNLVTEQGKTISRDYGHLAYGYVVTSHASQGTDVDRVFIAQSAESFVASSREQFYVSVSRGKQQATIYTDNTLDLLDAVRKTDERLSATELIDARVLTPRDIAILQPGWQRDAVITRQPSAREELAYDR